MPGRKKRLPEVAPVVALGLRLRLLCQMGISIKINVLSAIVPPIEELSNLRRWARDWTDMHRYGAEVLAILHQGCTQGVYGSEVA